MSSKQFGLVVERSDQCDLLRAATNAFECLGGEVTELPDVLGAEVGQFVLFPIGPEILDGVKLRSVSGKKRGGDAALGAFEIAPDPTAAMDLRAVPDQQYPAADLAPQL